MKILRYDYDYDLNTLVQIIKQIKELWPDEKILAIPREWYLMLYASLDELKALKKEIEEAIEVKEEQNEV